MRVLFTALCALGLLTVPPVAAQSIAAPPAAAVVADAADPADPANSASWGVAPIGTNRAHFDANAAPGATVTDGLTVVNHGPTPITLRVYASDAFTTATGGLDLLPAAQKSTDLGAWITVANSTVTVASQQSMVIPFTVKVPSNATPGDHTAGIVTSLVTDADGSAVHLDRRLGARYYLRVTGQLAPALTVTGVHTSYDGTLNPVSSGTTTVTYTVTNTGNVRLRAHQQIRVSGPAGIAAHSTTRADLPELLPGAAITRTVVVHGAWPTVRLTATVTLAPFAANDAAARQEQVSASGTASLWAWPLGQLGAVFLVAAAIAYYWWGRRRRARAVDAAIAAAVTEALARSAS